MPDSVQRITKLTPLADVYAAIDAATKHVPPRHVEPSAARGRILAADVVAEKPAPPAALALQDGWAVTADKMRDASGYAPALLTQLPQRIDAGQVMPQDADAVAPLGAIEVSSGQAHAVAPATPGDGVLRAGADCVAGAVLGRAGARVRDTDVAVFSTAGIRDVSVREPRLRIIAVRNDPILVAAARLIEHAVDRFGCVAQREDARLGIDEVLRDADADAIVVVGGTGSGRDDQSVQALARAGRVGAHGIAISPGETAAFGIAGSRPVLLIPGRLDAATSILLTIGQRLMRRLAGAIDEDAGSIAALTRKITSTVSLTEFVPVRRDGDKAEPLAIKYLPLSALANANGYVLVPAESEGFQAGNSVLVRPWL